MHTYIHTAAYIHTYMHRYIEYIKQFSSGELEVDATQALSFVFFKDIKNETGGTNIGSVEVTSTKTT